MTLRVTRMARDGTVIEQGEEIHVWPGEPVDVSPIWYPPCECPRHKHGPLQTPAWANRETGPQQVGPGKNPA
jgi:hypothetical protein